jgi:predicted membrane protein (TIGR00267 family)
MDFQVKMEKPSSHAAKISALVMGMSYFVGGFFPLLPYFLATADLKQALYISIGVAVVVLLFFGYVKAMVIGTKHKDAFISAFQTLVVGLGTAAMSYGIVRGFTQWFGDGVGG